MIRELRIDELEIKVFDNRVKMGEAAASAVGEQIVKLLGQQEYVNIVFASAPSQNEFLEALIKQPGIDWTRVNAFHVDEYIGLQENAPEKFGSFLRGKIFKYLPFHTLNYINGNAPDSFAECGRYAELLHDYPSDIVCLGIGENGHLAFNDPPADFETEDPFIVVDLDEKCREQQLGEGWFKSIDEVPKKAISMSIKQIFKSKNIICSVPGERKAIAVKNCLEEPVSNLYPASVLQQHSNCTIYLDDLSASLLSKNIA